MSNYPENLIPVGKILKVHGVKGELKISVDDNMEILVKGINIWFKSCNNFNNYKLEYIKGFTKNLIMKLIGIDSRSEIKDFLNKKIYISRSDFPEIKEDDYYLIDLIGLLVINQKSL